MTWDVEIDARGLLCPLPVLRARKRLAGLPPGSVVRVLADDPAARIDMPHFCATAGHTLVAEQDLGDGTRAFVIRGGPEPQAEPEPDRGPDQSPFER